jgi:hypothetical protein
MFMTAAPVAATTPHAQICSAGGWPNEVSSMAGLLIRLSSDGNIRAMEGLACVIVRSDWGYISARIALGAPQRDRMLTASNRLCDAAERTARRALAGCIDDPSLGATRFHRVGDLPEWAMSSRPCAQIGEFFFYRI